MDGLKSLIEDKKDFHRCIFTAGEYNASLRNRAKKYVEKYFFDEFVHIFNDLRLSADSGKTLSKNYTVVIPEELEISFATEMITTFLKGLGYVCGTDNELFSKKENSRTITLRIS